MDLKNKVGIVTGGSSGIGKAIAERMAWEGATIIIADVNREKGDEVANDIGCEFMECDVSSYEQVENMVEAAVNRHGKLDFIVNNAGIGAASTIEDMSLGEWRKIIDVDLDGVMHGCKAATPHLKETEGFIINIASIYGLVGDVGATAYNAAKGGVVNMTRSIADDLAQYNVNVNSVCPGFVETEMTKDALNQKDFKQHILNQTPMGRVAQPEEIAGLVAFLATEDASYITGTNIPVDGGWTSH